MKFIERAIEWLLSFEFDWKSFGWIVAGSTISALFPDKKKKALPRPLWQAVLQFAAGVLAGSAFSEWLSKSTGMPPGGAGFTIGLAGWGLVGFIVDAGRDPIGTYHRIRNIKEDSDNEHTSDDSNKDLTN